MSSTIYNHRGLQPTGPPPPPSSAITVGPGPGPIPGQNPAHQNHPPPHPAHPNHAAHINNLNQSHSPARLNESLEVVRQEFELVTQDLVMLRAQRDDFENKITGQVNELALIKQQLYELETQHQKVRQGYEDQLNHLRRELDAVRQQAAQQQQVAQASVPGQQPIGGPPGPPVGAGAPPGPGGPPTGGLPPGGPGYGEPYYGRDRDRDMRDRDRDMRDAPPGAPGGPGPGGAPPPQRTGRDMRDIQFDRDVPMRDRDRDRDMRDMRGDGLRDMRDRDMGIGAGSVGGTGMLGPIRDRDRADIRDREMRDRDRGRDRDNRMQVDRDRMPPGEVRDRDRENDRDRVPMDRDRERLPGAPVGGVGAGGVGPLERDRGIDRDRDGRDVKRIKTEAKRGYDSPGTVPPTPSSAVPPSASGPGPSSAQGSAPSASLSQPPSTTLPPATLPSSSQGNAPPPPSSTSSAFPDDVDIMKVPAELKEEGSDWFAIFNHKLPRALDVRLVHTLNHESVVCCVRFSADGKHLATGCNRTAQIYDTKTGMKTCVLNDETASSTGDLYIRSVCFSPDGKYLATGAEDKLIRIWDIAKRRIRQVFEGHTQEIYSLDFSKDGRLIVSGSGDRTTRIWDMETSKNMVLSVTEPDGIDAGVTSVAISPDGKLVAAGSLDTVVRIWDVTTGYLVERLRGHKDSVYSVAFTPDGKGLVSGSLDKTLKHWDLSGLLRNPDRNKALPSVTPPGPPPGSSSSNPSPSAGASSNALVPAGASKDGYGERGSQCTLNFNGHKDYVLSVAVSHDGKWVVSGSKDRGVQFWEARSAQAQLMLQGHKNSVISIDLSPTGGVLATGSGDWQARLWSYNVR